MGLLNTGLVEKSLVFKDRVPVQPITLSLVRTIDDRSVLDGPSIPILRRQRQACGKRPERKEREVVKETLSGISPVSFYVFGRPSGQDIGLVLMHPVAPGGEDEEWD